MFDSDIKENLGQADNEKNDMMAVRIVTSESVNHMGLRIMTASH